jgi:hypothetical protein
VTRAPGKRQVRPTAALFEPGFEVPRLGGGDGGAFDDEGDSSDEDYIHDRERNSDDEEGILIKSARCLNPLNFGGNGFFITIFFLKCQK